MASIKQEGKKWRAQVERLGVRRSRSFATKTAAMQWAAAIEAEILSGKGGYPRKTFTEALRRYVDEVSSTKAGERWERMRAEALIKNFPDLAGKRLSELRAPDMAEWRDARLKKVTAGSVQRDWTLLSHVFTKARDEWHWMGDSPLKGVKAPGDNEPRSRLPKWQEIRLMLRRLGYVTGRRPVTKQEQTGFAFLLALHTGMRAVELRQLGPDTVDLQRRVATLKHKTQYLTRRPREIPLSRHAMRLLRLAGVETAPVFDIKATVMDTTWRKARESVLIEDLHFHDSRAFALTRMARMVDVMTLAKISGHKDLRLLLDTYYRVKPEDIAARLD